MTYTEVLVFSLLCLTTLLQSTTAAGATKSSDAVNRVAFANDLTRTIAVGRHKENVVFSPFSIQTALVLAFMGARGQTANELRNGVRLGEADKVEVIQKYGNFLNNTLKNVDSDPIVIGANRIYVQSDLTIAPKFQTFASTYLNAKVQKTTFSSKAVEKINKWVEDQTQGKIRNILIPNAVNEHTIALILSAVYFKANWAEEFSQDATKKLPFWVSPTKNVEVDTMYAVSSYKYAEAPELDASIVELPYKNSNISMVIVLPNKKDGLQEVERKLTRSTLRVQTKLTSIQIYLPKFEIEFEINLRDSLKKLGISSIFNGRPDFSDMFEHHPMAKVDALIHKAYLSVNEAGSEAAAATAIHLAGSSYSEPITVRVDHPFVFAIRDQNGIYLAGHVVKP